MLPCLLELGMSEYDVNDLQRMNGDLLLAWDDEIRPFIEFLQAIGCTNKQIIKIVSSNPFVFDYKLQQLISTCGYLKSIIKVEDLPAVLTIHPYLLNKSFKNVKAYFQDMMDQGLTAIEVRNIFTDRPFVIECAGY